MNLTISYGVRFSGARSDLLRTKDNWRFVCRIQNIGGFSVNVHERLTSLGELSCTENLSIDILSEANMTSALTKLSSPAINL